MEEQEDDFVNKEESREEQTVAELLLKTMDSTEDGIKCEKERNDDKNLGIWS